MAWLKALAVPCPLCNAPAGKPCVSDLSKYGRRILEIEMPHQRRIEASQQVESLNP